jgi:hypothetical protein
MNGQRLVKLEPLRDAGTFVERLAALEARVRTLEGIPASLRRPRRVPAILEPVVSPAPEPVIAKKRTTTAPATPATVLNATAQAELSKVTRALTAIAQYPGGVSRKAVTVLTGFKRRVRDGYVKELKDAGNVTENDAGLLVATKEGLAALGPDFARLPVGDALRADWLAKLSEGERRVLEVVARVFPRGLTSAAITEATAYKRRVRDSYIRKLAARELVGRTGDGIRANPLLFDDGGRA